MPSTLPSPPEIAPLASELRVVVGQLIRRLRAEQHRFSMSQGAVLGRLDRDGPQSVSDLAAAEKVRPQSMAQTVADLESAGMVERRPDPDDRRRSLVLFTAKGLEILHADRRQREGWLAGMLAELSEDDLRALARAVELMGELADAPGAAAPPAAR
ncbi:MAG: winged helix-turn-helix transcriptional regulator [Actinobacteria bacterium]|nr:winged helix-turn-helix transcriptional regulator [Actinomycetota bacterium]